MLLETQVWHIYVVLILQKRKNSVLKSRITTILCSVYKRRDLPQLQKFAFLAAKFSILILWKSIRVQIYYRERIKKEEKYSHSSQGIISFNFHKWHCSQNSHIGLFELLSEYGWRLYSTYCNLSYRKRIAFHLLVSLPYYAFINGNEWNSLIVKLMKFTIKAKCTWPAVSLCISVFHFFLRLFICFSFRVSEVYEF